MNIKILALALMLTSSTYAASYSSLQLAQNTVSAFPSCSQYRPEGLCFWLACSWYGCWINTTLKVSEYLPDVTMSVFNDADSNPWDVPHTVIDPIALKAAQAQVSMIAPDDYGFGNASDQKSGRHTENARLKEVDALGNPAVSLFQPPLFIPSVTQPFVPYYQSMLDVAAWRSGLTEFLYPASLIPGMHEVGQFPYNVWGSLYPRDGFIDTSNDAKGAAVIAQRVASIITQGGQPHVYNPLPNSCGVACQVYAAQEKDSNTVQWQMDYPIAEHTCQVFGSNDLAQIKPWGSEAAAAGDGNYVWTMWQHYEGCIQGDGSFLGST